MAADKNGATTNDQMTQTVEPSLKPNVIIDIN